MPSQSIRQQNFFKAVKRAKHDPNYGDKRLRHVASSISDKDIDDFANHLAELKIKKAVVSILKDITEPMYLEEVDEADQNIEAVASTFHVKEDWAKYIKPYIGQPFNEKEVEALGNFKDKKPTTVSRTEIWYKTADTFGISNTTLIKKMKDSGQLSYTAFQKQERPEPKDTVEAPPQQEPLSPSSPTQPAPSTDEDKEDITVTKSVLFKDDIKGAAILVEFLKKLDL